MGKDDKKKTCLVYANKLMENHPISRKVWNKLRWEMKTSQLRELAALVGVDLEDIPNNTQQKKRIAERIYQTVNGSLWRLRRLDKLTNERN